MSRHDIDIPIYALTPSVSTRAAARRCTAMCIRCTCECSNDRDGTLAAAERLLLDKGLVKRGELIVLTIGEPMGQPGGTNTLKIVRVGEHA